MTPVLGVSGVEGNCAYKYSTHNSGDWSSFDEEASFLMFNLCVSLCVRREMDVRQQCV